MSLQISNTTTKRGLVQLFEKEIGAEYGDVSGNSDRLAEFIAQANNALDNYLIIWAKNAGEMQADDMTFTDFQIVTFNLVSGQRDYAFINDSGSHRILDVSKVLILPSATETKYMEIDPVDELDGSKSAILLNTITGVPYQYGKLSNAIFLDPVPSYSATNGVKMVVNREGAYLTTSYTTEIVGVPAYHEYFYKKPAFEYAKIHQLSNLASLEKDVIDLEGNERLNITGKIADFFSNRERDIRKTLQAEKVTEFR